MNLDLMSELEKAFSYKLSFLRHQERDLPACGVSEREGRLKEIEELRREISYDFERLVYLVNHIKNDMKDHNINIDTLQE
jgi:hypothetical protein